MSEALIYKATGRRKTSSAQVSIRKGNGQVKINGREMSEYFARPTLNMIVEQPLRLSKTIGEYDIVVNVKGGGVSGQAGAIRHGLTRALMQVDERLRDVFKKAGYVTRDSRMKERKKYGRKKARKGFQFSKR